MRLVARYLTKTYRHKFQPYWVESSPSIDRVSFSLAAGETLAVIGAAGSGKSTLARLLAGAEPLSSGAILIDGERFDAQASDLYHRDIRMIFQDASKSLNPMRTLGEQIDEAQTHFFDFPPDIRRKRIQQILLDVGLLTDHINFYPHMLTTGQKHRVALARALITDPKVLIADESLSSVDVSIRAKLVNLLLNQQKERQLSYVIITHDRELIRHMADSVMVLKGGRVVEIGTAEQILNAPENPYTAKLLEIF